ncbi:MAG: beta-N-acetylhexosaminidase [Rhodospirillaceae bacterium]
MLGSDAAARPPLALVLGCAGPRLTPAEVRFFAEAGPLGFILFARNCDHPGQVRALVAELRSAVGRADAPVLIDQEGGRVARLRAPHWRTPPAGRAFAALHERDPVAAVEAARLNARLIACDLDDLGIDVDCAPVADVPAPDGHDVIGDRALGRDAATVAALARATCEGLSAGGVAPVIKHIPGHGRAREDSHIALPVVDAGIALLRRTDFAPFRALNDQPMAMTAHVVYTAVDDRAPASASRAVIDGVIRGDIGFDNFLLSDDIGMGALAGSMSERTRAVLDAGCDAALHCSGELDAMQEIAAAARPLDDAALARFERVLAARRAPDAFDHAAAEARLGTLLGAGVA